MGGLGASRAAKPFPLRAMPSTCQRQPPSPFPRAALWLPTPTLHSSISPWKEMLIAPALPRALLGLVRRL